MRRTRIEEFRRELLGINVRVDRLMPPGTTMPPRDQWETLRPREVFVATDVYHALQAELHEDEITNGDPTPTRAEDRLLDVLEQRGRQVEANVLANMTASLLRGAGPHRWLGGLTREQADRIVTGEEPIGVARSPFPVGWDNRPLLGTSYLPRWRPSFLTPHRRWLASLTREQADRMFAAWALRRRVFERLKIIMASWATAAEIRHYVIQRDRGVERVQAALESLERHGWATSYATSRSRRYTCRRVDECPQQLRDVTHAAIDVGLEQWVPGTVLVVDPMGRVELVPEEEGHSVSELLWVPALQQIERPEAGRWFWYGLPRWRSSPRPRWFYGVGHWPSSARTPCGVSARGETTRP